MIKNLIRRIINEIEQLIYGPVAQSDRATVFKEGANTQNNARSISLSSITRIMCIAKDAISENLLKVIPRKLTYSRIPRGHMHPSWNAKEMVQTIKSCPLNSRFRIRIPAGPQVDY